MRRLPALLALLPGPALAETFQPPLPEIQTVAAALSYALAALGLVLALGAAQWLIARR